MLSKPLENFLYLTKNQRAILEKLNIKNVADILRYFPSRYESFFNRKCITDLVAGEEVTISGKVISSQKEKTWRKKMPLTKIQIADGTGAIRLIWFYQPYLANILKPETALTVSGKIQQDNKGLYLANPVYQTGETKNEHGGKNILPIYPESRNISSRWIRFSILKILKEMERAEIPDPIPDEILKRYHLPSLKTAFFAVHAPQKLKNTVAARKRFAFEEIFFIQLARLKERKISQGQPTFPMKTSEEDIKPLLNNLEFQPTQAQLRAINAILQDFNKNQPMARLLEGDVGSGKTLVAMLAAFSIINKGFQVAYMAPTEVLARQHFQTLTKYFKKFKIKAGLLTSSEYLKFPSKISPESPTHISRSQLLKWVVSGEIPMLVGTHALIQEKVKFKNLAFVIIDEQHRFGVAQRAKLVGRGKNFSSALTPHLLSMTATPIPRTLALTIYGDLDLTLLDEMPENRKKIITEIIPPDKRKEAYEKIREELKGGRQAYVVCPRIEPQDETDAKTIFKLTMSPVRSSADNMEKQSLRSEPASRLSLLDKKSFMKTPNGVRAVKDEYKKLSGEIFPEYKIKMLHGKMKPKEKNDVMQEFRNGKINVLVATSVIEVGVDVPNATVILIEGAERFGLSQLHQLRGRVIRSSEQPYCFIFTESKSQKTLSRLQALLKAKNGFELAEYDLAFRGPGELSGSDQWGFSDLGMEALKNIKMVEAARAEVQNLLEKDCELRSHPQLSGMIASKFKTLHLE